MLARQAITLQVLMIKRVQSLIAAAGHPIRSLRAQTIGLSLRPTKRPALMHFLPHRLDSVFHARLEASIRSTRFRKYS